MPTHHTELSINPRIQYLCLQYHVFSQPITIDLSGPSEQHHTDHTIDSPAKKIQTQRSIICTASTFSSLPTGMEHRHLLRNLHWRTAWKAHTVKTLDPLKARCLGKAKAARTSNAFPPSLTGNKHEPKHHSGKESPFPEASDKHPPEIPARNRRPQIKKVPQAMKSRQLGHGKSNGKDFHVQIPRLLPHFSRLLLVLRPTSCPSPTWQTHERRFRATTMSVLAYKTCMADGGHGGRTWSDADLSRWTREMEGHRHHGQRLHMGQGSCVGILAHEIMANHSEPKLRSKDSLRLTVYPHYFGGGLLGSSKRCRVSDLNVVAKASYAGGLKYLSSRLFLKSLDQSLVLHIGTSPWAHYVTVPYFAKAWQGTSTTAHKRQKPSARYALQSTHVEQQHPIYLANTFFKKLSSKQLP